MTMISLVGKTVITTKVNLRQGAPNTKVPVLRKLVAGSVVPIRGIVIGESVQGNAHWYLTDEQCYVWSGACAPYSADQAIPGAASQDAPYIAQLIATGGSPNSLAQAQAQAGQALVAAGQPPFPHNACAATLSALLQLSGIAVPMTLGAGKLAHILGGPGGRGWSHVAVGGQQAGDVGVCFDEGGVPGADHIYLVLRAVDSDEMLIADNQEPQPHPRFASGKGKTPTEYFLRAK